MSAVVRVENLAVRFGAVAALESVSFEAAEKDFVAIVGPNGAGKSTLLRTMLGLIEPTEGKVELFGCAPREATPEWIGYVPQVKSLDRNFPGLGIELAVSGLRRSWPARIRDDERKRAMEMLERVGAAQLANKMIGQLSGGELQRLYLARGLIHQPKLILLDEPATGLDITGEADMFHILEAYQRDTSATVMMITHDWGAALHHTTRVLLLNRRMIGYGPPAESLREEKLGEAFGHRGHHHAMKLEATT